MVRSFGLRRVRSSVRQLGWLVRPAFSSRTFVRKYGIVLILLVEMAFWTAISPAFLTVENLTNVARQASVVGIAAIGMTFCVIAGSIDLSVGSMVAFAGMVAAIVLGITGHGLVAIVVTTLLGLAIGIAIGVVMTKLQLSAFIVTLAMLAILHSLALIANNGYTILAQDEGFRILGIAYVGPIPVPAIVLGALFLLAHWVLSSTVFGRRVYAIGGNPDAARYSGIRVDRYTVAVHALVAASAAFAGVVLAARLGSGTPAAGVTILLDIIAAVIIGGTSVYGGVGTMWGTLVGVLILAFLRNGLTLVNVSGFYQELATGSVLMLAVVMDRFFYAQKRN